MLSFDVLYFREIVDAVMTEPLNKMGFRYMKQGEFYPDMDLSSLAVVYSDNEVPPVTVHLKGSRPDRDADEVCYIKGGVFLRFSFEVGNIEIHRPHDLFICMGIIEDTDVLPERTFKYFKRNQGWYGWEFTERNSLVDALRNISKNWLLGYLKSIFEDKDYLNKLVDSLETEFNELRLKYKGKYPRIQ
jgi:hypothetical protein